MTVACYLGVIGPGDDAPAANIATAYEVGQLAAQAGHIVVTGGLGGVMAAVCRGAREAGGLTVGLLPGDDRAEGNAFLDVALTTGLGEMRNGLLVRVCDALVCVGGSWGTLSEVALAVRTGVPVVSIDGWPHPAAGVHEESTAAAAVQKATRLAQRR